MSLGGVVSCGGLHVRAVGADATDMTGLRRALRAALVLCGLIGLTPHRAPSQSSLGLDATRVLSDGVSVRVWTVESGLPQSTVSELVSDRDGYVWGATFGGLFRFDGRAIVSYTAAQLPMLASNAVTALHVAPGGDLLVGTPTGLVARLTRGAFVDSLPSAPLDQGVRNIDVVFSDRPGEMWVRKGSDVHRVTEGRWSARLPYDSYSDFAREPSGALLYVGPRGLIRVDPQGRSTVVMHPDPTPALGDVGLHVDRRGRVWIGQQRGVWRLERGRVTGVPGVGRRVQAIISEPSGALWIGAERTLYRYRPPAAPGEPSGAEAMLEAGTNIISLALTKDGLLVIGTLDGLLVLQQSSTRLLAAGSAFPEKSVGSLAAAPGGTLYVTSGCGPVRRMTQSAEVLDTLTRPAPQGCSTSLLTDARERLWMGGDGVIRRHTLGPSPDKTWTLNSFLSSPPSVRALIARGDTVAFGLSDGRVGRILPDDRLEYLSGWSTPTDVPIHAMAWAADGAIWVAQMGMLHRWFRGKQAVYHRLHGIPNVVPRALLPEGHDGVWIGTYGSGLWHFRIGTTARVVPLPDATVSALIMDDYRRLWMSGNRGITVVAMAVLRRWLHDSTETPVTRLLSADEGVPEGNNGSPAAVRLGGDLLAFASVAGVVAVHSSALPLAGETPPLQIDSIRTDAGRAPPKGSVLRLDSDDRGVLIGFSAASFRFANAMTFRYRLDGRDDSWQTLGLTRTVRLSSLLPGSYELRIEGRVPGGNWRAAPSVAIVVPAQLHEQPWFWFLVAGGVIGGLVLALLQRARTAQATARAREIELQARRDAAELAEQHQQEMAQVGRVAVAGELTASLSHELGQPLAAIVNNAEVARRLLARQVAQGATRVPAVEEALLDVVSQGRRASQVVREFRRFLRREQGDRELLSVQELVDSTTLLLRQEFANRGVPFYVEIVPDTPAMTVERVLLQQVLVNLLQNALEAVRGVRGGYVLVRARPVAGGVRLSVVDNGSGFAADVRRSAFEPFVTTRASGMGMGLAIARRVVEAHGGRIGVGHMARAGAVVSMWLPTETAPAERSDSLVPLQVTTNG